jgi:hypothetical protein
LLNQSIFWNQSDRFRRKPENLCDVIQKKRAVARRFGSWGYRAGARLTRITV